MTRVERRRPRTEGDDSKTPILEPIDVRSREAVRGAITRIARGPLELRTADLASRVVIERLLRGGHARLVNGRAVLVLGEMARRDK